MPLIELTVPEGALPADGREHIQRTLAKTLLKWEGAPDTAFIRSISWSYLHEIPRGAVVNLEDDEPRFRVDATVPAGALSERRKAGLVEDVTAEVLKAAGLTEADSARVWVLIHEQPEGTWGGAGRIVKFAELAAAAKQSQEG
ncbi:tautomerase family protein [Amycolatopsis anabasis]|uniref:tautomerase family protein n=1 Tax=Amycolatopsis anabasis TaxID=1840409 RepID=UPI00131E080F|nr:tautomerase family protein [Amycolatopsis anabasis]